MRRTTKTAEGRTETARRGGRLGAWAGAWVAACAAGPASAQPTSPVYQRTFTDCITGDNAFIGDDGEWFWDVDPGCDIYQIDTYERPTASTYQLTVGRYGAEEYFEYLDIVQARAGFDDRYLYIAIDLFGRDNSTSGGDDIPVGMMERYGFRISTDPDGRNGLLVVSDQPEVKNEPNTVFGRLGTFAYRDTNGDVGGADRDGPTGLTVTKTDNPDEESGLNGYNRVVVSDGRMEDERTVLWVRLDPADDTIVELALDYGALGFSAADLCTIPYLDVEAIKGGPGDPQNYLWNDKYTNVEAGSPNPGPGGASEFGTQGLGNIYEADTVRGGPIVCPADFNRDCVVNSNDFFAFLGAFFAGSPSADFNGDGVVNSDDFFAFVTAFLEGCGV